VDLVVPYHLGDSTQHNPPPAGAALHSREIPFAA
jgi:hypothetical protein